MAVLRVLVIAAISLLALPAAAASQDARKILVVTAASGDYLFGAGGTLAKFIREGHVVHVAQFGNDEKFSTGLSPAQTRLANVEEAKDAAKLLGVRNTVYLGHKSGEFGYVSSTEMRTQLFGLIRYLKPRKIFIPDPYVHYQDDWDRIHLGRLAEEAWGYSGGGTFANELARLGLEPYGTPEVYYYSSGRPYRPGEGGEHRAQLNGVDITSTIEHKVNVIELLRSRNRVYAALTKERLEAAGRPAKALEPFDDLAVRKLIRAYVEELAATIGAKHGFPYGEEFNYVDMGTEKVPPHALERAIPKR